MLITRISTFCSHSMLSVRAGEYHCHSSGFPSHLSKQQSLKRCCCCYRLQPRSARSLNVCGICCWAGIYTLKVFPRRVVYVMKWNFPIWMSVHSRRKRHSHWPPNMTVVSRFWCVATAHKVPLDRTGSESMQKNQECVFTVETLAHITSNRFWCVSSR